jgi:hypothetical protein
MARGARAPAPAPAPGPLAAMDMKEEPVRSGRTVRRGGFRFPHICIVLLCGIH